MIASERSLKKQEKMSTPNGGQRRITKAEIAIACILCGTAALKLVAAAGNEQIITLTDPILLIPNRWLLIAVAGLELAVALYIIRSKNWVNKQVVLGWLALSFSIYRIGWKVAGLSAPCPCLGTGYAWFPWLNDHINGLSLGVFFLLLGVVIWNIFNRVMISRFKYNNA